MVEHKCPGVEVDYLVNIGHACKSYGCDRYNNLCGSGIISTGSGKPAADGITRPFSVLG